jgi:TolB-like protein
MLPASGTRMSRRPRIWTTAAVAIGVVGVLGGAVAILQHVWDRLELAPFAGTAPKSIAVLPFENLTPQLGGDDMGDVIAQRILDELDHIKGLKLVSSRSSRSVRGRNLNTREIGRLLAANWTVGGTYRLTADSVHFSVEMASTRDGFLLWDRQYDRPRRAVPDVQKDVAREVAMSLGQLRVIGPPARTTPATAGAGQREGSEATVTRPK